MPFMKCSRLRVIAVIHNIQRIEDELYGTYAKNTEKTNTGQSYFENHLNMWASSLSDLDLVDY